MNVLFVGGSLDGEIVGLVPMHKDGDIRVDVGDSVEFYRLDPDIHTESRHMRGLATFYKNGESARSLIDLDIT